MRAFRSWRFVAFVFASNLLLAQPAMAQAGAPRMELRCQSMGKGPRLECALSLRDAQGNPITGAEVKLRAHMPAMPMAHSVPPATALPAGKPGEYRGSLQLEMSGVWAVQVDLARPKRQRWIHALQVNECNKPCVAPPARAHDASKAR